MAGKEKNNFLQWFITVLISFLPVIAYHLITKGFTLTIAGKKYFKEENLRQARKVYKAKLDAAVKKAAEDVANRSEIKAYKEEEEINNTNATANEIKAYKKEEEI